MQKKYDFNRSGYDSYCPYTTQKSLEEIKPVILDLCDTISTDELPPFPELKESAEKTLHEACATLTPAQISDLVNYYCSLHDLRSPLTRSCAQTEELTVLLPLSEPSLL